MKTGRFFQLLISKFIGEPAIPDGKTTGFSLVRSEKTDCRFGNKAYALAPYLLRHVIVGDGSYLARNSHASHLTIGKFCSIGPNFCCGLGVHPTDGITTSPLFYRGAVKEYCPVRIGNDVFIGANVTVLDGVSIGDGAVIGAGAVVSKDIPPYAVAVGCPIKIIRYRMTESQINAMLRIQWWNWPEERLCEVEKLFFDVEAFIRKFDVCAEK